MKARISVVYTKKKKNNGVENNNSSYLLSYFLPTSYNFPYIISPSIVSKV